jgi:hypothetical protein
MSKLYFRESTLFLQGCTIFTVLYLHTPSQNSKWRMQKGMHGEKVETWFVISTHSSRTLLVNGLPKRTKLPAWIKRYIFWHLLLMLFLLRLLFYDDDGLLSLLFCADVSVLFSSVVLILVHGLGFPWWWRCCRICLCIINSFCHVLYRHRWMYGQYWKLSCKGNLHEYDW